MGRESASPHSKIVVQLDEAAHVKLAQLAEANERTIRDQARYMIKCGLGLLPPAPSPAWDEARRSGIREVIDWIESHEASSSWTTTDLKRAVGIADA